MAAAISRGMAPSLHELARRYVIEVLEERATGVLRGLVHWGFVRRGPLGEVSGIAAFEEQVRDERFRDICIVIDDIIATGDQAVIRYTWHARHRGEVFNIPPTDKRISINAIEVIRVEHERIVEADVYFDVYSLFEQLGQLPQPHQLAPPPAPRLRTQLRLVR